MNTNYCHDLQESFYTPPLLSPFCLPLDGNDPLIFRSLSFAPRDSQAPQPS